LRTPPFTPFKQRAQLGNKDSCNRTCRNERENDIGDTECGKEWIECSSRPKDGDKNGDARPSCDARCECTGGENSAALRNA
jgi:hypothetical protein